MEFGVTRWDGAAKYQPCYNIAPQTESPVLIARLVTKVFFIKIILLTRGRGFYCRLLNDKSAIKELDCSDLKHEDLEEEKIKQEAHEEAEANIKAEDFGDDSNAPIHDHIHPTHSGSTNNAPSAHSLVKKEDDMQDHVVGGDECNQPTSLQDIFPLLASSKFQPIIGFGSDTVTVEAKFMR
jgi:hypothetical protein